ncbi:MAG: helix-turn-helix domain-containing protein [Gammaproteobacteria bacterium]
MLLLTIVEAAQELRVSTRTVRRLIQTGDLTGIWIRRSFRIRSQELRAYVDSLDHRPHNSGGAGPGVLNKEPKACHTDAKTVPFGGCRTPTQTDKELDTLLEQRAEGRPSS